ncbi:MAG: hypothetical protein WDZ69_01190 [Candidatus Pacearchaeota archaeon]
MTNPRFPVLAVIILIFAIVWFFEDMGYYSINLPWIPVIIGIIAIGMIFNRFNS